MTLRRSRITTFIFIATLAFVALPAWAQEKAPDMTTLWGLWSVGGIVMYPILALCIAAVTISIFGYINTPEKKMLTTHLIPQIQDAIDQVNLQEVQTICNANPSLLTNILSAGVQRVGESGEVDVGAMEKAMEEASVEEASAGMRTISYLSICAQLAPMLGLLGTVTGMIKAFEAISHGGMGKPDALAGNIGEAMITTAFGLIVGIPSMFAYFHLKTRYNTNLARLSRVMGNLLHRLTVAINSTGSHHGQVL